MINNDFALENFITFCDDMIIAEEGLRSSIKEGKKDKKIIKDKIKEINNMPETTKLEIDKKIKVAQAARNEISDMIKKLESAKPELIEKIISVLSMISGTIVGEALIIDGSRNFNGIGGGISMRALIEYIGGILIGITTGNQTVAGKNLKLQVIISALKRKDKELESIINNLR